MRLPVIQPDPYRRYPARRSEQRRRFSDERAVCCHCLGGSCCSSEGPIALTAFDVLRLAAHFDLSPARFLGAFTQDRFADYEPRQHWPQGPGSSIITFLRRRANYAASPCIFLKYIRDRDGTPRRVCSVHPARPLACREYYYDTCKRRWTGELAAAQAAGLEQVRDGYITAEVAEREYRRAVQAGASLRSRWDYAFWAEMRRALDIERANTEGAKSFEIRRFQDPIKDKLNRLLSTPYLRFEEKYGLTPNGEQLDRYEAGMKFNRSHDRTRLLSIIRRAPEGDLYQAQDYPHQAGIRTMSPGVALPSCALMRSTAVRPGRNSQSDMIRHSIFRGWAFLISLGAHARSIGDLVEFAPSGAFEFTLLTALLPFSVPDQLRLSGSACLEASKRTVAARAGCFLLAMRSSLRTSRPGDWLSLRLHAVLLEAPGAPKSLRHIAAALRREADRHIPRRWLRGYFDRWLRRHVPHTGHDWQLLVKGIDHLCVCGELRLRHLRKLECLVCNKQTLWPMFMAMSALVRPGLELPTPVRRRIMNLAHRWANYVEDHSLWDNELLLQWAGVCGGLGIAGGGTPGFQRSVAYILNSQSPDGSWGTDVPPDRLPDWQGEFLQNALTATAGAARGLYAAWNALRQ